MDSKRTSGPSHPQIDSEAQNGAFQLQRFQTALLGVTSLVKEMLAQTSKARKARLGAFLTRQEAANRELARNLHDVFSQELAALSIQIANLFKSNEVAPSIGERLNEIGKKIGELAEHMHRTSRELHPTILTELGLVAALREQCENFSEQLHIPVAFAAKAIPSSLPENVALCLYRVTQESLLNIRKHAGATRVKVQVVGNPGGIKLRIDDTGDGFDVDEARARGGLGLVTMEERVREMNGSFTIRSRPGIGTSVRIFVPV